MYFNGNIYFINLCELLVNKSQLPMREAQKSELIIGVYLERYLVSSLTI